MLSLLLGIVSVVLTYVAENGCYPFFWGTKTDAIPSFGDSIRGFKYIAENGCYPFFWGTKTDAIPSFGDSIRGFKYIAENGCYSFFLGA